MSSKTRSGAGPLVGHDMEHAGAQVGGVTMSTGLRQSDFTDSVKRMLGNTTTFHAPASVNLDLRQGTAHSTTSLPYQIGGSATVVSQKVGTWLASFQDPIRAILGTGIHKDQSIIIRRKYVVGSAATITPERAPARTVAIQEDVREVQLTRYGGDIEMNLNQFLVPGAAEEEMEMKIDAQKMELERTLCDHGYSMLMREGTNIVDAIMRSNPAYSADTDQTRFMTHAHKIYATQIFGAINKFRFPVTNLLAAARYASAYSVGTQKGSVMILPHGIPDMLRYARRESMEYSISGVKSGTKDKKLTMQLDDVYVDTASDVKILIHHPTPRYDHGAAFPDVSTQSGGLTDTSYVFSWIGPGWEKIPDVLNGGFIDASSKMGTAYKAGGCWRVCKVVASSAVLAAPGAQTGELLIGYPFTSVSTSQADERMRVQLRCYLGSVLYQPDNVLIMPNCHIDGIIDVEYIAADFSTSCSDHNVDPKGCTGLAKGGTHLTNATAAFGTDIHKNQNRDGSTFEKSALPPLVQDAVDANWQFLPLDHIKANLKGAVFDGTGKLVQSNTGEFGRLDDPHLYMGLHGAPAVYENGDYDMKTKTP